MTTSRRRRHLVVDDDDDDDGKEDGKKNTPSKLSSNSGGVLKKDCIFFDRLIKDVSRVDFAAPAPAYLENDLGQSNVRRYLLEPGPKDGSHSRCRIVRKKDAFGYCTYVLYADCPSSVPSPPTPSSMVEDDECGGDERKEMKQRQRRYHRFEARALCAARKRKKSRR